MSRISITGLMIVGLAGCADSTPLGFVQGLLGYIPPPEETTIAQEMELEYERCLKIGKEKNCAQAAYDVVRRVKGLEPRPVPKGVVIILEGDGNVGKSSENPEKDSESDSEPGPESDKN